MTHEQRALSAALDLTHEALSQPRELHETEVERYIRVVFYPDDSTDTSDTSLARARCSCGWIGVGFSKWERAVASGYRHAAVQLRKVVAGRVPS